MTNLRAKARKRSGSNSLTATNNIPATTLMPRTYTHSDTPHPRRKGQSQSHQLWPQVAPPNQASLTQLDGNSPTPIVEGRGRGQRHRLTRFGLQSCHETGLVEVRWEGLRALDFGTVRSDASIDVAFKKNRAHSPRKMKRDHRGSPRSATNKVSLGLSRHSHSPFEL